MVLVKKQRLGDATKAGWTKLEDVIEHWQQDGDI
jgi:hypothetical protein